MSLLHSSGASTSSAAWPAWRWPSCRSSPARARACIVRPAAGSRAHRPDHPHGVAHGNDVIHTLGTGDIFVSSKDTFMPKDREMSGKVTAYWFSFANTGTPAGTVSWTKNEFASPWLAFSDKDNTLKLGEEPADIKVQKNFRRVRLNQFIALYPKLEAELSGEPPQEPEEAPEEAPEGEPADA